jgi:hypothetical protein
VGDEFEAIASISFRRCFDLAFDLIQRERIIGAFVPVALVIESMKIKPVSSAVMRQSSRSGQAIRCIDAR